MFQDIDITGGGVPGVVGADTDTIQYLRLQDGIAALIAAGSNAPLLAKTSVFPGMISAQVTTFTSGRFL